jgi:hypothetical protein
MPPSGRFVGDPYGSIHLRSQRTEPCLFERFGFTRWGKLPKVAVLDAIERDLVSVGRRV